MIWAAYCDDLCHLECGHLLNQHFLEAFDILFRCIGILFKQDTTVWNAQRDSDFTHPRSLSGCDSGIASFSAIPTEYKQCTVVFAQNLTGMRCSSPQRFLVFVTETQNNIPGESTRVVYHNEFRIH